MKKLIPLFIILFIVTSCNFFPPIDVDPPIQEEESEYLYAQQIYYSTSVNRINELEIEKEGLIAQLEDGDESVIEELEYVTFTINQLEQFTEYLQEIPLSTTMGFGPIGPIGPFPIPIPPPGCLHVNSCMPMQNFTNKTGIVALDEDYAFVYGVEFKNENGEIVGELVGLGEDQFGQKVQLFDLGFEGDATMRTTMQVPGIGYLTLETPVENY